MTMCLSTRAAIRTVRTPFLFTWMLSFLFLAFPLTRSAEASEPSLTVESLSAEAEQSLSAGDLDSAARMLRAALQLNPGDIELTRRYAWLCLDTIDQPDEAYRSLRSAQRFSGLDLVARKLLALASAKTQRYETAIELYRQVLSEDPSDLWMRLNLAETLAFSRRYEKARTTYESILNKDKENFDALLGLARVAAWEGRTNEAHARVMELLMRNERAADVHNVLGDIALWNSDLTEAERRYLLVIEAQRGHYGGTEGMRQIASRRATIMGVNYSFSEDSDELRREQIGTDLRIGLGDHLYLTPGFFRNTFKQGPSETFERLTGQMSLKYLCCREFEIQGTIELDELEGSDTTLGGQVQAKWSPRPQSQLFVSYQKEQPVDDSLSTILANVRQYGFGIGQNLELFPRLSTQVGYSERWYSDDNTRRSGDAQLSVLILRRIQLFGRVSHEFVVFDEERATYWTPSNFQCTRLQADARFALTQSCDLRLSVFLPYVWAEGSLGYGIDAASEMRLTGSLSLDLNFFRVKVPGTEGRWSVTGGTAKLDLRF